MCFRKSIFMESLILTAIAMSLASCNLYSKKQALVLSSDTEGGIYSPGKYMNSNFIFNDNSEVVGLTRLPEPTPDDVKDLPVIAGDVSNFTLAAYRANNNGESLVIVSGILRAKFSTDNLHKANLVQMTLHDGNGRELTEGPNQPKIEEKLGYKFNVDIALMQKTGWHSADKELQKGNEVMQFFFDTNSLQVSGEGKDVAEVIIPFKYAYLIDSALLKTIDAGSFYAQMRLGEKRNILITPTVESQDIKELAVAGSGWQKSGVFESLNSRAIAGH